MHFLMAINTWRTWNQQRRTLVLGKTCLMALSSFKSLSIITDLGIRLKLYLIFRKLSTISVVYRRYLKTLRYLFRSSLQIIALVWDLRKKNMLTLDKSLHCLNRAFSGKAQLLPRIPGSLLGKQMGLLFQFD